MSTSNGTPSIAQALAAVKKAVGPVGKEGRNTQQNYNFRGIDAVVNAAAPHLDEQGVISLPVLEKLDYSTVEVGQKRTPMAHVRVEVVYQFWGPAGDHMDAKVPGEAMDSGDKATAKAMSVAYRIALLQVLNLPTSDPDPDTSFYERSPAAQHQQPPREPDEALMADWQARIDEITTPEDAARVDAELKEVYTSSGRMDFTTANAIRDAIASRARSVRATQAPRAAQGAGADDEAGKLAAACVAATSVGELRAAWDAVIAARKAGASFTHEGTVITIQSFVTARRAELESQGSRELAGASA